MKTPLSRKSRNPEPQSIVRQTNTESSETHMFGMPGPVEMLVIGAIALLLFGKRLPEVARNLGSSMNEFQKGMRNVQNDMDQAG